MLEHLYILNNEHMRPLRKDDNQWLELFFHLFTALYLSRDYL